MAGHQMVKGLSGGTKQQGFNINIKDLQFVTCKRELLTAPTSEGKTVCGWKTFFVKTEIRRLSKIHAPDGRERLLPVETYYCEKCGTQLTDEKGNPITRIIVAQ